MADTDIVASNSAQEDSMSNVVVVDEDSSSEKVDALITNKQEDEDEDCDFPDKNNLSDKEERQEGGYCP